MKPKRPNRGYVIVENAGMNDEFVHPEKFGTIQEADKKRSRIFTKKEIEDKNVDICFMRPDGTITTEI